MTFSCWSSNIFCAKNSSRLPVLIVTAAYQSVEERMGERVLSLKSHNAADLQTGALGDVEICLKNDDAIVTAYEMKKKRISKTDIDLAVEKILRSSCRIHNYIFITTEKIESECNEYAAEFYEKTGGTEIAILDCLGFLKHFLHFFHRFRKDFLDHYQELVLAEPDSAVSQNLKEAFLTLRKNAETE
jgi:hypothetical protein